MTGPPAGRLLRGAGRVHHRHPGCRAAGAAAASLQPGDAGDDRGQPVVRDAASGSEIDLMVGRSTVLNVGAHDRPRVADGADIADAMVTAPIAAPRSTARSPARSRSSSGTRPAPSRPSRSRSAATSARSSRTSSSSSPARTSPCSAAARTSSSPAPSPASTSSRRPPTSPAATSRRKKTSSTC